MLNERFAPRISDASSTSHLDKVERGYENMDHFTVNFKKEGKALRSIDFIQGERTELFQFIAYSSELLCFYYRAYPLLSLDDEDGDDEDEDVEAAAEEAEGTQTVGVSSSVTAASDQPSPPQ